MSKTLVVDIETKDPGLNELGPSIIRGGGRILYVSTFDGVEHVTYGDPAGESWKQPKLVEQLADPSITKVFHNGLYDMNWLINGGGLKINGRTRDTMTRATLLDEYAKYYTKEKGQGYSLDACCLRGSIGGKNKLGTIDEWWKTAGGKGKAIENLDKIPAHITTAYVRQDVQATWDLFNSQEDELIAQELLGMEELNDEMNSIALMAYKNGVRIDEKARNNLSYKTMDRVGEIKVELESKYGIDKPGSPLQLKEAFHELGLLDLLMLTDGGAPSFSTESLKPINHPLAKLLSEYKQLDKMLNTFLMGQYVDFCIDGRIHPMFLPSFGEDGGAKTGRMACQAPNLQNVPKQGHTGGGEIRPLFIANEGCKFCKFDYSQIEYLILSHYAILIQAPGWERLRDNIIAGIKYHKLVQSMLGWGDEHYTLVKALNFGSVYGMGLESFITKFYDDNLRIATERGQTVREYCTQMREDYFANAPFVRPTTKWIMECANENGYVRSFGGMKHRQPPMLYNARTGRQEVATYKLVNYLIQGGASDILKKALVKTKKAGIWDYLELNLLVHDEIDYNSDESPGALEAEKELEHCMVTAQELEVPIRVEGSRGPNWKESED